MEKEILDFTETLQTKLNLLEGAQQIVLSTCLNNHITSRVVDCAVYQTSIYFITWGHHTKCTQIRGNPNVAFCFQNLQTEGIAKILGNPFLEDYREHSERFQAKQQETFRRFAKYDDMVLVKADIHSIHSWEGWDNERKGYFLDIVDLINEKAFRIGDN
jgi:general stress protein 26